MDEYISREATVKAFCEKCKGYYDGHCVHRGECDIDVIQTAPAADVQPIRHGRWIDVYTWTMFHEFKSSGRGEHFWCSECEQGQKQKSNYCPNCGARMIKDGDAE